MSEGNGAMEATEPLQIRNTRAMPYAKRWVQPILVSAALVVPCLWLPIVSSVDLQSHLYNAWLAQSIANGSGHGLSIVHQSTNVLVDLLLSFLLGNIGVAATERVVAILLVLVFFWGAFSFLSAVRESAAYGFAPWLAIFAYGFTFQMGLLNYYLATGIVFWIFGIVWRNGVAWKTLWTLPLLCVAWLAHPIPVLWLLGVVAYWWMASRMRARLRILLLLGCAVLLVAMRVYLASNFLTVWTRVQWIRCTGADQFLLHGWRYLVPAFAWMLFGLALLCRPENRWRALVGFPAQAYALTVFAIVAIPSDIRTSMDTAAASLIADRLSLLSGVLFLAMVSRSSYRRWHLYAGLAAAAIFFASLYQQIALESRAEAKIQELVASLPPGVRVLQLNGHSIAPGTVPIPPQAGRLTRLSDAVLALCCSRLAGDHLLARACIGHCYDYSNYEPATGQFRIHAAPGNPIALAPFAEVVSLNSGKYVIQPRDIPVYALIRCGMDPGDVFLRAMKEGESTANLVCPVGISSR